MPTYSDAELLTTLRELADDLGEQPTAADLRGRDDAPSARTYQDRFGSWTDALEAAGFDARPVTEADLIDQLQALADEQGRTPTIDDVNDDPRLPHRSTFADRFGSFSNALEAAGLEPNRGTRQSDAALLDALERLTRCLDRVPSSTDMDEAGAYSAWTYRNRWGDWATALRQLNLEPRDRPRNTASDRELIADLREFINYGHPDPVETPTKRAMDADGPHAYRTYRERFGSWAAALVEAGADPHDRITDDEVLEAIQAVADAVGRPAGGAAPTVREWRDHGELSMHTVRRRFGTWNDAVAAAGYTPNEGRPAGTPDYSVGELIQEVRRVASQLETVPTEAQFGEYSDLSPTTIHLRVGSWHRALEVAGLRPRRQSPGGSARGTSPAVDADRAPGTVGDPRIDAITVEVDGVPYPIATGDILLDEWSQPGGYHVHEISAGPVALSPVWRVETVPVALESPHTRTFYGEDLRAWLGGNLIVLSQ